MFRSLDISTSGLTAQRTRMDVIAGNLAMMNVTEDEFGRSIPYRRRYCVFQSGAVGEGQDGVKVAKVEQDMSDFRLKKEPGHKDAIPDGPLAGYVRYPNIDPALEMVDAIEAQRAYEANVAAFQISKSMLGKSLQLLG